MFSRPKILFLVSLAIFCSTITMYLRTFEFLIFYHSSLFAFYAKAFITIFQQAHKMLQALALT